MYAPQTASDLTGTSWRDEAVVRRLLLKISRVCGLFALSRRLTAKKLRILCYHGIWLGDDPLFAPALFMRAATFERRLALIKRLGYPVLPLAEAVTRLDDGTLPPGAVAITIDDGWYGTYLHMLPALRRARLPATIYATTYYIAKERPVLNLLVRFMMSRTLNGQISWTALFPDAPADRQVDLADASARAAVADELNRRLMAIDGIDARWAEVVRVADLLRFDLGQASDGRWFDLMTAAELKAAAADGFAIELHTHKHGLREFDRALVIDEVQENRRQLARMLDRDPGDFRHFCYPSGRYRPEVFPVLRALGVSSATTTVFGLNGRDAEPLALKRILDHESLSELDIEAQLSGFWSFLSHLAALIRFRREA